MPQRAQVWNSAVRVPNEYLDTSARSLITTSRAPRGLEVHTPPCLMQNEQLQARAGISAGSGSQVRENEIFPQKFRLAPAAARFASSTVACGQIGRAHG